MDLGWNVKYILFDNERKHSIVKINTCYPVAIYQQKMYSSMLVCISCAFWYVQTLELCFSFLSVHSSLCHQTSNEFNDICSFLVFTKCHYKYYTITLKNLRHQIHLFFVFMFSYVLILCSSSVYYFRL